MTEAMIVEAVRAAGTSPATQAAAAQTAQAATAAADPDAVARFEAALAPQPVADIPFASQVAASFDAAQGNYQQILHRIHALTSMSKTHALSAAEMSELQYEVANLAFQQEIVTNLAKKASDAVSTLVKNG